MLSKHSWQSFRLSISVIVCLVLFACAPPTKVAVVERVTVDRNVEIDRMGGNLIRHVAPGETLYSIAFEMGLDVNQVAAWNGVTDTTKLPVGKRLRLTKPIGFVAPAKPQASLIVDRPITVVPIEQPAIADRPAAAPISQTVPAKEPAGTNTQTVTPLPTQAVTTWNWPLDGKVVRGFSQAQGRQGIDIQGNAGQAVLSTSAGEVVYVGNSLKGYGNLVIIKHSEAFLSAYAHNSEIFVREGEKINARQRIASVGTNRDKEAALHFQIRKNGQPVNPISYLAKKG